MNKGDRVQIKRGQPWAGEKNTYTGEENTLVGIKHKIQLDNGFGVLQDRNNFVVLTK